ncbi:MAG: methyltransferase [Chitinophagales bacterium]|nr:methyltransferase [Chitinophagales bacterium]
MAKPFRFKQFEIHQDHCPMKVNTDGVLLGAWSDIRNAQKALDIGTGTGVIAMMLAERNEHLNVKAIEIDKPAFLQAASNVRNCIFANRIQVYHYSIQDYASISHQKYDLIISNPPYFDAGTLAENPLKANVRHTIQLPHEDLLIAVQQLLKEGGHFDVILPVTEGRRLIERAEKYGLFPIHITEVYPKTHKPIERLLIRLGHQSQGATIDQLIIHNSDHPKDYTAAYIQLTKDFYLFM